MISSEIRNIKLSDPFFIFSMDVESLYTNIDTTMGLEAVQTLMDENPDPSRPDPRNYQVAGHQSIKK